MRTRRLGVRGLFGGGEFLTLTYSRWVPSFGHIRFSHVESVPEAASWVMLVSGFAC